MQYILMPKGYDGRDERDFDVYLDIMQAMALGQVHEVSIYVVDTLDPGEIKAWGRVVLRPYALKYWHLTVVKYVRGTSGHISKERGEIEGMFNPNTSWPHYGVMLEIGKLIGELEDWPWKRS